MSGGRVDYDALQFFLYLKITEALDGYRVPFVCFFGQFRHERIRQFLHLLTAHFQLVGHFNKIFFVVHVCFSWGEACLETLFPFPGRGTGSKSDAAVLLQFLSVHRSVKVIFVGAGDFHLIEASRGQFFFRYGNQHFAVHFR